VGTDTQDTQKINGRNTRSAQNDPFSVPANLMACFPTCPCLQLSKD